MKLILASVSALALMASPALAQGNGHGNGNGNRGGGNEHAQHENRGGGNGRAERGDENRGGGNARAERSGGDARDERGNGNARRADDRPSDRADRAERGNDRREVVVRREERDNGNRRDGDTRRRDDDRDGLDFRIDTRGLREAYAPTRGLIDGCPPGLARRNNGCTPPGHERQQDRRYRYANYAPDWWGYRFSDAGRYFYDDGFLLRYDGNRVAGYIPLLGGALAIGNPWPTDYGYSVLPSYYENYYGLGQRSSYRYADNVVYRLDPETAAITSIAALLTGDDFAVGQPMPAGYDVYNVPYSYREQYYDRPDALYRYSDGYVYQVDPETRLIAAAIELLI